MTKPDGKGRQAQSMDKERRNGAGSGAGNPVTREVERKVAQSLKKDCKPLGILYEALLNAEDSIDNVAAATDPGKDHGGMRASEARDPTTASTTATAMCTSTTASCRTCCRR